MKRKNISTVTSNYIDKKCLKSNKFYNFCEGYDGVILNNNIPYFKKADLIPNCFQQYTLDKLERCGAALAENVCLLKKGRILALSFLQDGIV